MQPLALESEYENDCDDHINTEHPRQICATLPVGPNHWAPFRSEKQMKNAFWIKDSNTTKTSANTLATIHQDDPNFMTSDVLSKKIHRIAEVYPQLDSGIFTPITLRKGYLKYAQDVC